MIYSFSITLVMIKDALFRVMFITFERTKDCLKSLELKFIFISLKCIVHIELFIDYLYSCFYFGKVNL